MNSSFLSKTLYALVGVLTLTTAALYLQNRMLSDEHTASRELCEQEIANLFSSIEASPTRKQRVNTNVAYKPAVASKPDATAKVSTSPQSTAENDENPKLQRFDESLEEIVKRKYRFLLARLDLSPAEMDELLQLLIEREQISMKIRDAELFGEEVDLDKTSVADLRYELENIDDRIQAILASHEENSQRYAMLKDSDSEQYEFSQYTLGITGLFPLNAEQQEVVLFTRLKHKQEFEREIATTGYNMDYPLTRDQQTEIIDKLSRAASTYKEAFLKNIRPHLDHDNFPMDQYTLLENYTNTEFETLIANLRTQVEGRGLIGE